MTQIKPAAGTVRSFFTSLLVASVLVAPFAILEIVNQRVFREGFPWVLFAFMSVHSLLIVVLLKPALRRLRLARTLGSLKARHWTGLALSAFLIYVYAGVVIDQLPCFLGVPNCD